MIAQLISADGVAIFGNSLDNPGHYRLVAASGRPTVLSLSKQELLEATTLGIELGAQASIIAALGPELSDTSWFEGNRGEEVTLNDFDTEVRKADAPLGATINQLQNDSRAGNLSSSGLSMELAPAILLGWQAMNWKWEQTHSTLIICQMEAASGSLSGRHARSVCCTAR